MLPDSIPFSKMPSMSLMPSIPAIQGIRTKPVDISIALTELPDIPETNKTNKAAEIKPMKRII